MMRITRSLLHRSRCSARRRGRGAAGGSLLIPMLSRRLTVAPFLQPALSASSAVWPPPSGQQLRLISNPASSPTPGTRLGSTQDDAAGLDAFDCCKRMHASDAASRTACLSTGLEAAQRSSGACHRACHPLTFCACLSEAPGCAERPLTPAQTAPVCLFC